MFISLKIEGPNIIWYIDKVYKTYDFNLPGLSVKKIFTCNTEVHALVKKYEPIVTLYSIL